MSQEFLPRDPAKAVVEIKEMLYQRLKLQREFLAESDKDEWGYVSDEACLVDSEVIFLQKLLDIIERS